MGVSAEFCTLNKGTSSSRTKRVSTQCSALYITSKGGGLIYSLDNPRAPSEVQLPCKYPPELRAGGRGQERDVKFREERSDYISK